MSDNLSKRLESLASKAGNYAGLLEEAKEVGLWVENELIRLEKEFPEFAADINALPDASATMDNGHDFELLEGSALRLSFDLDRRRAESSNESA